MKKPAKKKVMIIAGGTGGHVYPGLAVARYLREQGVDVVWMGTRQGLEASEVPAAGFRIRWITIKGLRRRGALGWVLLPFRLALAMTQALIILLRERPGVVLAMGGFVAGPGAIVARMLRKPLIIHEQNAVPGLTNRILAFFATYTLSGFPAAFGAMASARHVGNPVRPEIGRIPEPEKRLAGRSGPLRLLVLGGSQGARAFNEFLPRAIGAMPPEARPEIVHQCGTRWFTETDAAYRRHGVEARVLPFIDDMAAAYQWADLVICRAGAMTVAELAAAGVAAILVPYPHAVDDHQTANARYLADHDAAILLPERDLSVSRITELLREFAENREVIEKMAVAARGSAILDATDTVAGVCMEAFHA